MLFKLVSNGKRTDLEMDGKRLDNVAAVTFLHRKDGGKNDVRVCVEFDLTANTADETKKKHVFVEPWERFSNTVRVLESIYEDKKEAEAGKPTAKEVEEAINSKNKRLFEEG